MPDLLEGLQHLQALGVLLDLELGAGQVVAQLLDRVVDVDAFEQVLDAFGAHLGDWNSSPYSLRLASKSSSDMMLNFFSGVMPGSVTT
jgi:predicted signal transduction protein with EAL and GGDEF domain